SSGANVATPSSGARQHLASLPLAAQAQISAALGGHSSAYRVDAVRGGVAQARNSAQRLAARFSSAGVQLRAGALQLGLSLRGIGYGTALRPVEAVTPSVNGNRVTYAHQQLSEWYLNGPLGLEQGFTVPRPPSGRPGGPLTLSLALAGMTRASLSPGGRSVVLGTRDGSALSYGALSASDARGRTLPSSLALDRGRLLLHVDARGASFPVRIDPLVQQGARIRGSEEVGGALLGFSVALSADGDTALVGGPRDNGFAGAVWVFTRSGGIWTQQGPKLTGGEATTGGSPGCGEAAGEEADECSVGRSVALSGDGNTAIVGSPRETGPCPRSSECANQGAAWVFTRSGSTWSLQTKLTGGTEETGEGRFGHSVALSADGNTALAGAPSDHSAPGAAWVFTRSGSTWAQQGSKLTAGEEQGEGHLGGSAALSGDGSTALIGGPGDNGYAGAAWVFKRFGSGSEAFWSQVGTKLTGTEEQGASHFGFSVTLSGDATTGLVGGRADNSHAGAAWAFALSGSSWAQQGKKLTAGAEGSAEAEFGYSLALSQDGKLALIGAPRQEGSVGAAWLFARSADTWIQDGPKLTGDQSHKGLFGMSVALRADGTTALVGAPNEDGKAGAVWVFADPAMLPAVEALAPDAGPQEGGTPVTITGSRLGGVSAVRFGPTPAASFTVNPDGSVTAVSPANPKEKSQEGKEGKVHVIVTTPEGESPPVPAAVFTYVIPPVLAGVSPAEGPTTGGTRVTITGRHVGERAQSVSFGALAASGLTVNSPESLTVTAPPQPAGTVRVSVSTAGGQSKPVAADRFTYVTPPNAPPPATGSGAPSGGGVLGFTSGCSASLLSRSLPVLSRGRATVKLRWRGAGTFLGKVRLTVRVKSAKKVRTKTIATGTFALAPNRTRTLVVRLNAVGRAQFRSHHGRLRASLLILSMASGRTQARSASVRLTVPPKPRRTTAPKHA
ncbi:MAG: Cadherin-like beta sandwich domain protein, partial [Solirubrobacterales bacterium]|nr:Cadherin-like beta sandwich domain protein [Solirubrobacterales bacterium]